jgi:hypothetical protein
MKLRDLLQQMLGVQKKIGASIPYICGGTPRDRYMGHLENIADIDITTGDKTVEYLSQEFAIELRKKYNAKRTVANDGHSSIMLGTFKMDFSSNFNVPGIEQQLVKLGIQNPTDMQKEMFSRDFTCNALLLSFDLKNLMDPTHRGFQDIKKRLIRTCLNPEITLTTNKNRVIRAIYLAAKLDFDLDPSIITYVQQHPDVVKISTNKVMLEKLNEAFQRDADKASHLITQMGLWHHIPIPEIVQPYYQKFVAGTLATKKAYFQGGGGGNQPTPGKTKYPIDPTITVQPRFVEPFYYNYDLYNTKGLNGPAKHGPGAGWHHMQEFTSIEEFLKHQRQRLRGKYVAQDTWITEDNYGERQRKMKLRASLLAKITKTAGDQNDGGNFDYGKGLYSNMSKYKSVEDFEEHANKGPGAFFADDGYVKDDGKPNGDLGSGFYENLDKYESVGDFIQHTPLGYKYPAPIKTEKERSKQAMDFPYDQIETNSIIGDSESYDTPIQLGPTGPPFDTTISPGQVNLGDFEAYPSSAQLGGIYDKYLGRPDEEDKTESNLDWNYDHSEDTEHVGGRHHTGENDPIDPQLWDDEKLEKLVDKYLNPQPTSGLFGLPDGVDLPDEDLGDPTTIEPDYGTIGPESTIYQDKWNI